MDCGQEHAAALAPGQQLSQLFAAFYAQYRLVTDVVFGVGELFGKLVVEIGAVSDQQDRGAFEVEALHQQSRQKQHRETLAATGRTKVCAAFAVAFRFAVFFDVLIQLLSRIKLRVPANDFLFGFRDVREVNEVPEDLPQPPLIKKPLQHCVQRVNAIATGRFVAGDFLPRVEEFIVGEH